MESLKNNIDNAKDKMENKDILNIQKDQNNFLNTTLGKIVNTAIDVGLKFVLPDLIENQVIQIKDVLIKEGLEKGIDKAIDNVISFGKNAIGMKTKQFDNIEQVQKTVEKGDIINSIANVIDNIIEKAKNKKDISNDIANIIKQGKNILLDNISVNIENTMINQINAIDKIEMHTNKWNTSYQNHDFEGMKKEYQNIQTQYKNIIPLEKVVLEVKKIENLHNLIKNNGQNFNLTEEEIQLANKLIF